MAGVVFFVVLTLTFYFFKSETVVVAELPHGWAPLESRGLLLLCPRPGTAPERFSARPEIGKFADFKGVDTSGEQSDFASAAITGSAQRPRTRKLQRRLGAENDVINLIEHTHTHINNKKVNFNKKRCSAVTRAREVELLRPDYSLLLLAHRRIVIIRVKEERALN